MKTTSLLKAALFVAITAVAADATAQNTKGNTGRTMPATNQQDTGRMRNNLPNTTGMGTDTALNRTKSDMNRTTDPLNRDYNPLDQNRGVPTTPTAPTTSPTTVPTTPTTPGTTTTPPARP